MKTLIRSKHPRNQLPFAIGAPALVWQGLFFYIPLALIVIFSFVHVSSQGSIEGFTLYNVSQFFSPIYLKVIFASLLLALTNAILCFCLAFPLAYFISFKGGKYKNIFLFFLIVPFWTNFLLHVYA